MSSQGAVDYSYKWINDNIHGHIRLDKAILEYVDSEPFQRLRDLKQLGSAYFVFPGASHNRFEHSIGVCHLAGQLVERFASTQPELGISREDVHAVKVAGLCHDLGKSKERGCTHDGDEKLASEHGPAGRPGSTWTHEEGSQMMLDYLIDENHIDIDRTDSNFIKSLIDGVPLSRSVRDEKGFLFEIVANKKNSVDVDKFDYISRDCYNVGLKTSYDFDRLMNFSRVINNEICYHSKEVYNLYEMFHTRYSLFKRIYTHRVAKAIEFMITDAMVEADPYLHISDAIHSPSDYVNLSDAVLHDIARSKEPGLERARAIIHDIRQRNLYKFVDEVLVPKEAQVHLTKDRVTAEGIAQYQDSNLEPIAATDIIIDWLRINYAMKDRNPVDNISFYSRYNDFESFHISRGKVSFIVPEQYEETAIRIYTRDPDKLVPVQKAFRRWVQQGPLGSQHAAITPNPSLTVPTNYMSPRKKRESGLGSPANSFNSGLLPGLSAVDSATGSPVLLAASRLAATPATDTATKRLRLDDI